MSGVRETALVLDCDGEQLVSVISTPATLSAEVGVLVVVGGPQYRVGSHRQFVLLARALSDAGVACMRFDVRGMGDSAGDARDFEHLQRDIEVAVDAFMRHAPGLSGVVLWGLCDGASAACFQAANDPRVAGLVLLNPWVRTEEGHARTVLRHYYLNRLMDRQFWKKLLGGQVGIGASIRGFLRLAGRSRQAKDAPAEAVGPLPERMLAGVCARKRPALVILSGRDYVAREFDGLVSSDAGWRAWMADTRVTVERLDDADHTFSSAPWRDLVSQLTERWVRSIWTSPEATSR